MSNECTCLYPQPVREPPSFRTWFCLRCGGFTEPRVLKVGPPKKGKPRGAGKGRRVKR